MVDGNFPIKLSYQSHSESKEYSAVLLFHVLTDNKAKSTIYGYKVKKKRDSKPTIIHFSGLLNDGNSLQTQP
jgi:hypothetical protein